jgi:hypothetical protein
MEIWAMVIVGGKKFAKTGTSAEKDLKAESSTADQQLQTQVSQGARTLILF